MYQKTDYEEAIRLVTEEKLHLDELITHRFDFDNYLEAYRTIEDSGGEYLKVLINLD